VLSHENLSPKGRLSIDPENENPSQAPKAWRAEGQTWAQRRKPWVNMSCIPERRRRGTTPLDATLVTRGELPRAAPPVLGINCLRQPSASATGLTFCNLASGLLNNHGVPILNLNLHPIWPDSAGLGNTISARRYSWLRSGPLAGDYLFRSLQYPFSPPHLSVFLNDCFCCFETWQCLKDQLMMPSARCLATPHVRQKNPLNYSVQIEFIGGQDFRRPMLPPFRRVRWWRSKRFRFCSSCWLSAQLRLGKDWEAS